MNLSLNSVSKVRQLQFVENLGMLTELDMCFNPIQNRKFYRAQTLYHIPQLRMLDGTEVAPEEKVRAENLHSVDMNDRETIFSSLLPQETFVDRRMNTLEMCEQESDDPDPTVAAFDLSRRNSGGN